MRVDNIVYHQRVKIALDFLEMLAALVAEIVEHNGRALGYLRADVALAVENTHRVALEPVEAGAAQLVFILLKICLERLVILGAAGRAADRVYLERQVLDSEESEYFGGEGDYLGIGGGSRSAEDLNAELVELPVSAGLRLLVAIARGYIAGLLRQGLVEKPVLQECARSARSALGSERYRTSALVEESIHLLLHDIGGVADAAGKQLRMLEHGSANLLEAETRGYIEQGIFKKAVFIARRGQHILSALDSFRKKSHVFVPSIKTLNPAVGGMSEKAPEKSARREIPPGRVKAYFGLTISRQSRSPRARL